jgi:hypothetical protein
VRICHSNHAAVTTFGSNETIILNQYGGQVLHCVHSQETPDGCGKAPSCRSCVIRNSVEGCFKGQTVTRRRAKFEIVLGETRKELDLLITASPMPGNEEPLALLIMEDISEYSLLKDILPICVKCKNIRDDQDFWHSVDSYFRDYIGVEFTHGLCPNCLKEVYPNFAEKIEKKINDRSKGHKGS